MSLNYNIIDALKLLFNVFKYNIFYFIVVSSILLVIILVINKNKKISNYIILCINILLITLILYYYSQSILAFKFNSPINNMYFYFFNSIIYLVIMIILNFNNKFKIINYIFYGLVLINLLYSLFMTHYLNNINLIVIANIFPMIKFGNIIYFVYYMFVITCNIKDVIKFLNSMLKK